MVRLGPTVARWLYAYIFEQLPAEVLDLLRAPQATMIDRRYRDYVHRSLLGVDTGSPQLDNQISLVIVLMRISQTRDEFDRSFIAALDSHGFGRAPLVVNLPGGP